jgi:hypothetical protein
MQSACAVLGTLSYMACPLLPCFSKLSHKWHNIRKMLLSRKYLFRFSLQLLPEIFLILRIIQRDTVKMYIGLHVNYLLFLSDCNESRISSTY